MSKPNIDHLLRQNLVDALPDGTSDEDVDALMAAAKAAGEHIKATRTDRSEAP